MGSGSDRELQPECNLVPGPSTSGQAPVHSVPASEVATSEQLSSLNVPQATPPPAAAVTLTASNNNAVSPTNLPGITASVAAAESDQPTASDPAVNLGNVTPVGLSQVSAVLRQSTTYTPESSNNVPDPTKLPALEETQPSPNSRGATSTALLAASEYETLVGMPMAPKSSLSPTSERPFAVSGTDQTSMPPIIIPTTAPAILTILNSAHNTHTASQRVGDGRTLNSSATARDSASSSSVGSMDSGTSGQKLSTAADTTANVTAPSRPLLIVSSTSSIANKTTASVASTVVTQISSSSSASLLSAGTTATSPATSRSSSSAGGFQLKGAGLQSRGLEMIRLLGCLTVCMVVGARILA